MSRRFKYCLIILLIISSSHQLTHAAEYIRDENPAPDSVEEVPDPINENFRVKPRRGAISPYLKDKIKDLPPFFSDSHVVLNARSFYFDRSITGDVENVAWALGGSLSYESGLIKDIFSIGTELFTSQKLYGPEDKDGTLLLKPGQEGFTVLGRAYAKLNYQDIISASFYRQYYNLPYVNKQFSRMVPNTFEGYSVSGDLGLIKYIAGYISKMKERNSDEFISMSNAAGVDEVDNGLFMLGILFEPHVSAQFTDQSSIGDDLLTGSDFSTQVFSSRLVLSYEHTVLGFAFSTTSNDRRIISPYGGYPGYISLMVNDFNRAGEEAFLLGLSYNFGKIGLDWLSFVTLYAYGYDAIDPAIKEDRPDRKEFNITVDFRPKISENRDLWLRVRYANVDIDGQDDSVNDFRIILNYYFTAL